MELARRFGTHLIIPLLHCTASHQCAPEYQLFLLSTDHFWMLSLVSISQVQSTPDHRPAPLHCFTPLCSWVLQSSNHSWVLSTFECSVLLDVESCEYLSITEHSWRSPCCTFFYCYSATAWDDFVWLDGLGTVQPPIFHPYWATHIASKCWGASELRWLRQIQGVGTDTTRTLRNHR